MRISVNKNINAFYILLLRMHFSDLLNETYQYNNVWNLITSTKCTNIRNPSVCSWEQPTKSTHLIFNAEYSTVNFNNINKLHGNHSVFTIVSVRSDRWWYRQTEFTFYLSCNMQKRKIKDWLSGQIIFMVINIKIYPYINEL